MSGEGEEILERVVAMLKSNLVCVEISRWLHQAMTAHSRAPKNPGTLCFMLFSGNSRVEE